MKTDRELLGLAAKAAGIEISRINEVGAWIAGSGGNYWNPLTDDGAALRLAVKLQLLLNEGTKASFVNSKAEGRMDKWAREQHKDSNPSAATRRAIVRAAATIGEAMP